MKTYGRMEIWLQSLLISEQDGGFSITPLYPWNKRDWNNVTYVCYFQILIQLQRLRFQASMLRPESFYLIPGLPTFLLPPVLFGNRSSSTPLTWPYIFVYSVVIFNLGWKHVMLSLYQRFSFDLVEALQLQNMERAFLQFLLFFLLFSNSSFIIILTY